jgi:HEAT repeat protein
MPKHLKERSMKTLYVMACMLLSAAMLLPLTAAADDDAPTPLVVFDREKGELSPGTGAPKRQQMVNTIMSSTPTRLYATLEYGERVECFECIPLLAEKILKSNDAQTREISAWWLRRRTFGFAPVMVKMKQVASNDADPVRRARAASALGEFLDPKGQETLSKVATEDSDTSVRVAAVRALGRLNVTTGHAALSSAFSDKEASVRKAALDQVLKVNFFHDNDALLGTLGDADAEVRRTAVQLVGELKLQAGVEPLLGILMTDENAQVRQAAAIALGHIGGADARDALTDARKLETSSDVLDAITVAQRMR